MTYQIIIFNKKRIHKIFNIFNIQFTPAVYKTRLWMDRNSIRTNTTQPDRTKESQRQ